jgi:putative PEP-CTERM system histidine kinase
LTGFALLAPPHAGTALDWEVRDLLKTASRQAAVFLAQLHAAEALLEARKFEAFNRMSAFVVHDLKNIVTQLSLMMKNAKRLHDNPEFQQDMLMTVESSLDKMRQLMLQLREGERPAGGPLGVDLLPLVQRIAQAAEQRGRTLEFGQTERVATRGHPDRIERVLGHIVQNAFDATPAEGRVWVDLVRVSGQARVIVGDTGQGMTREFVESRLFKPFASTKATGMGIGTYESSQYVRELGGQILVDSEPGRGTVITVVLPLFDAHVGSDLQMTAST